MKTQSPDTHPDIERIQIEGYRRMSVAEKWKIAGDLNRLAVRMIEDDVRRRYPEADEEEVRRRAASRWLPAELMRQAFGWNPDEKGY